MSPYAHITFPVEGAQYQNLDRRKFQKRKFLFRIILLVFFIFSKPSPF